MKINKKKFHWNINICENISAKINLISEDSYSVVYLLLSGAI